MSWDLATAKLYLGIEGSSQDAEVQVSMDTTLAAIETMLSRAVQSVDTTETLFPPFSMRLLLTNYPISVLTTVDGDIPSDEIVVNNREGWIQWRDFVNKTDPIDIEYTGGFDPIPADLERCMYEALDYLWSQTNPDTGGPEDGGLANAPSEGSGDMSRITIQDFGSITYDAATALSGDGGRIATERILDWGWLAPWASVLQMYRSESGVGLGVA